MISSAGRREALLEVLLAAELKPPVVADLQRRLDAYLRAIDAGGADDKAEPFGGLQLIQNLAETSAGLHAAFSQVIFKGPASPQAAAASGVASGGGADPDQERRLWAALSSVKGPVVPLDYGTV